MTKRIAITSQKGGCGKTTVALNLALALAERGSRTLLVDLDPQGGIGHALAKSDTQLVGLAEVLMAQASADSATNQTHLPALAILPRGALDPVDVCEYEQSLARAGTLAGVLEEAEQGFEFVILDTPAGVGMVTRAALAIADFALIPAQGEPMALRTISQVLRVVEHVRAHENPTLQLLGILPTMVERNKEPSMRVLVATWQQLGGVLETVVPRADVFLEASEQGVPLAYLGGKLVPEARRFAMLASEVTNIMAELSGEDEIDVERPQRRLL